MPSHPLPLLHERNPLFWLVLATILSASAAVALMLGFSPLLSLAGCLGVVAIILLFRAPLILLAGLFIIRMSLDYSAQYVTLSLFDISLSLSQLLGVGIAGLGVLLILTRWKAVQSFPLLIPFLIVSFWGAATLFYSINRGATLSELLRFFDLFVIGLLAYVSVTRYRDFRTLLLAVFASSGLPILFGIYQFIFGIGLQDENVSIPRIFGTFSHPNVYSLFLFALIALGTLYFLIYAKTRPAKLLTLGYLSIVTVTLLLTYARIAWITLFVFLGLLALSRAKLLIVPLMLLPLSLIAFSPSIQDRVTEALHPTPDSSITWRQNLWHDMLLDTRLRNREWLGSGMDTFRTASESLRGLRFGSNDPHNDFVKFYVEGGRVGVIVLSGYVLSFLILIGRIYTKTPSHTLRALAAITSFIIFALLLASLSDNIFKNTPVQWLLWMLLGGLLALYRESMRKALL